MTPTTCAALQTAADCVRTVPAASPSSGIGLAVGVAILAVVVLLWARAWKTLA